MDKSHLRMEILKVMKGIPEDDLLSLCFSLTGQIVKFFNLYPELTELTGAGFLPLSAEVAPMYQELLKNVPLDIAYPVLEAGEMRFGIPEGIPKGNTWMDGPYHLIEPDWFFVPGLAFDLNGGRLGRGKGFYDRYLEGKDGARIGLCWSEQIVDKIPMEGHDSSMDFIITEKFCWSVAQQSQF